MADHHFQVNCRSERCTGVLGAFLAIGFIPAGHLVAGRDLWVDRAGTLYVRCTRCTRWHRLITLGDRFEMEALPAA